MAESANAAFVRRTYELVNAGDLGGLATGFEEGFEWHPDRLAPGQRARRSVEDVIGAVEDFTGAFAQFRTEVEELTEQGHHVIAGRSRHRRCAARRTHRGRRCGTAGGALVDVRRRSAALAQGVRRRGERA